MRFFTIDYRKDRGGRRGTLVNRGLFLHQTPRLTPWCRLFGHRPVVDGYDSTYGAKSARWVACRRCGVRPNPQGRLDGDLVLGQAYTGPYGPPRPAKNEKSLAPMPKSDGAHSLPGPWPAHPTGEVGGQVVVGHQINAFAAEVTVGCAGSENTLSAHVGIHPLFGLYLHTAGHGQWLQRRLNAIGYEDRVIGVSIGGGHLRWQVWTTANAWSSSTPRWRDGSLNLSILDRALGPKRYSYEDVQTVTGLLRLPHGDEHLLTLTLKRQTHGRTRGRKTSSWIVGWSCRDGIPYRAGDRVVMSSAVDVRDEAVEDRGWPAEALAAIAYRITKDRTRYGFGPIPDMLVPGA
ncbi:hypothetical protein ACFWMR_01985 [Amycolatopsis thailandensis]|uniref:hypothetical protein n=1 Tax=Amycolatopsis thailandensis TaxID=589330 RepID=UPI0036478444